MTPIGKLHRALGISIRAGSAVVFRLKEVFASAIFSLSDPDL
jgi:hypothetical protein